MSKDYSYEKSDESIITPAFEKFIVKPALAMTPKSLPANVITLFSNLLWYAMIPLLLFNQGKGEVLNYILIPVGMFLYMLGDFIDGDQAVRTGTQSPLGDFIDHFLDCFNNGILIFYFWMLFDMTHPWMFVAYLGFSYLGGTALVYEHYKRGIFHFGRFGTSEGLVLAMVVVFLAVFSPVREVLRAEVFGDYTVFELVFLVLTVISYVPTFTQVASRLKGIGRHFPFYIVGLAVLSWAGMALSGIPGMITIISLYSGVYIGRLIAARLAKASEPFPDLATPAVGIVLALLALFFDFDRTYAVVALIVIATVQVLFIFISTVYRYRHHWLWINPVE